MSRISAAAAKAAKTDNNTLAVGTRVEVLLQLEQQWQPGTVVACDVSHFEGACTPRLVRLDEGSKMILAPAEAIRPLPCFFDYLDDDLVRMVVRATTEGGGVRPPAALRGVDQRLRTIVNGTRIWRDEWVDMWMERCTLLGEMEFATRSKYEVGGDNSVDKMIENYARNIKWKVDNGWPRKQAEAYTLITACLKAPLAAAMRERSKRYAASTHVLCETLARQAKQMTQPAPLVYVNLTGRFGLATNDPVWQVLLQPGANVGVSFVTDGLIMAAVPNAKNFRDDKGFYKCLNTGGKHMFQLQDSDIVCFRSASSDADGYHSLVQTGGAAYELPPCATVTLEKVEQPGEWEARGLKVQRRLLTVRVTWNEKWWWW